MQTWAGINSPLQNSPIAWKEKDLFNPYNGMKLADFLSHYYYLHALKRKISMRNLKIELPNKYPFAWPSYQATSCSTYIYLYVGLIN